MLQQMDNNLEDLWFSYGSEFEFTMISPLEHMKLGRDYEAFCQTSKMMWMDYEEMASSEESELDKVV